MLSVGIEGQHEDRAEDKALLLGRLGCVQQRELRLIIAGIPDFPPTLTLKDGCRYPQETSRGRWLYCQIKRSYSENEHCCLLQLPSRRVET